MMDSLLMASGIYTHYSTYNLPSIEVIHDASAMRYFPLPLRLTRYCANFLPWGLCLRVFLLRARNFASQTTPG